MTDEPSDWLDGLSATDRARALRLIALLQRARVANPEAWVQSELRDDIAQTARAIFLRSIWPKFIDVYIHDSPWIDNHIAACQRRPDGAFADAGAALERLRDVGASDHDLGRVARAVAYEAVFNLLYHIDFGADEELEDGPGWRLVEVDPVIEDLTGRELGMLHESILTMDPSGGDGSPD